MSNYPIPVIKIAADAPLMQWQTMHTWQSLYQMHSRPDDLMNMLAREAATAITQQFIGDVLKREKIETRDDPEGKVMRFTCVALRYDQLVELLYRAYREGQSDGMHRTSTMEALNGTNS
jgi:hypothetical protein